ncbi:MAG: hypothetical protein F9K22_06415 [Bacteroidetes bacterium]|nr:MAG: hypothetical protein F9K22_06415 [Bacteroidota bacterium]
MTTTRSILTLLLVTAAALTAGAIRDGSLLARSDGNNVTVQWASADESAVKDFTVERRSGTAGEFVAVAVLAKKGSNSYYEYIDRSAFKTTGTVYQYRIRTNGTNGAAELSAVITVTHNVSSVKRTWGSLKAMFR